MNAAPYLSDGDLTLHHGDALAVLRTLDTGIAQTCVTSPPYYRLRDYSAPGQLGLEPSPGEYIAALVAILNEAGRVLATDGTLWLVIGDSYAGSWGAQGRTGELASRAVASRRRQVEIHPQLRSHTGTPPDGLKPKELMLIPERVAIALQLEGWWIRQRITWCKPNAMPESAKDRPTSATETIWLLSRHRHYYYDGQAIAERAAMNRWGGATANGSDAWKHGSRVRPREGRTMTPETRNARNYWIVPTTGRISEDHPAPYPEALVTMCVLAGSRPGDLVLDPFTGSGTTNLVARRHGRRSLGIDLNADFLELAADRCRQHSLFAQEAP